jgi:hypothetical protein
MTISIDTIFSVFIGIGLAAAVGFRVFVPLFALSLASFYAIIPLNEHWEWVGSNQALVLLGIATLAEIMGYLIPWFDNLLDTIAVPLAAIAGTVVMVATVSDLSPVLTWVLAIIAGGGTATAIKGSASTARLAATTTTAGIANPLVSAIETGSAIVMAVFSIFIPIVAIIFVSILFWILIKLLKRVKPSNK